MHPLPLKVSAIRDKAVTAYLRARASRQSDIDREVIPSPILPVCLRESPVVLLTSILEVVGQAFSRGLPGLIVRTAIVFHLAYADSRYLGCLLNNVRGSSG